MGVTEEGKAFRILHSSGPCCKFGIKACFSDFKALDPAPERSFLPLLSLLREPALRSGRNAVATAGEETARLRGGAGTCALSSLGNDVSHWKGATILY